MLSKKFRLKREEIEDLKKKKGNVLQGKFFGLIYEAPPSLRSGYLLPSLRRERNPSEAESSSHSSRRIGGFSAKGDQKGKDRKFALILSNKLCRKATERNRIKRLFYRAVEQKPFNREGKFLFLAKRSCLDGDLAQFEKELAFLGSRLP